MKPSGARTLVGRGLEMLSKQIEKTTVTQQPDPVISPETDVEKLAKLVRRNKESNQTLKKAEEAELRSKLKTRRLVELCGQVLHKERKSEAWFAKYEKFFRSPVWKLVSDEAIRRAHFKCEYWKCQRQATRVHLLEFPEEHLEPNFDWMHRDNILIALCNQHHWMMHGFIMKSVVPSARQFDSIPNRSPSVVANIAKEQVARQVPIAGR